MKCRVCLIENPGNHHRQHCCRACAAFFRRTVQLKLRYKCKRSGHCKLTKENRYFCKYCRMKRCISAGMTSPEDPDQPLNFYLDDSPPLFPTCGSLPNTSTEDLLPSLSEDDIFTTENVFTDYSSFFEQFKERILSTLSKTVQKPDYPFQLTLFQQASVAYEKHRLKWPNCSKEKVYTADVFDIGQFFCDNKREASFIAEFCMEILKFSELPIDQRRLLWKKAVHRFIHLVRAFITVDILGNDLEDGRTVYFNGQVADLRRIHLNASKVSKTKEKEVKKLFLEGQNVVFDYLIQFKRVNPDSMERLFMLICSLWNVAGIEGISADTVKLAEDQQERLCEELTHHYKFDLKTLNYAARIYKLKNLFNILDKIDISRKEDTSIANMFDILNFNTHPNCTALFC